MLNRTLISSATNGQVGLGPQWGLSPGLAIASHGHSGIGLSALEGAGSGKECMPYALVPPSCRGVFLPPCIRVLAEDAGKSSGEVAWKMEDEVEMDWCITSGSCTAALRYFWRNPRPTAIQSLAIRPCSHNGSSFFQPHPSSSNRPRFAGTDASPPFVHSGGSC